MTILGIGRLSATGIRAASKLKFEPAMGFPRSDRTARPLLVLTSMA